MPTVTGFFSRLNKIIREHQEALDKWLLLLTLIQNIHSKNQFCIVWGQGPSTQRHLGSIKESKEPRIWSLNPGHTTSDHVASGIMGTTRKVAPLVTPGRPDPCGERYAVLGTRSCQNASPGKGTRLGSSLTLSFDVSFLWEACPVPFPPQGERRAVWPCLGKFLGKCGPVPGCGGGLSSPGQPRGSVPTLRVNKSRFWRTFRSASAPFSARLETPSAYWDLHWCPHPGLGTERNHTAVGRCP